MTAAFIYPLPFTQVSGNVAATNPISNMNSDQPGVTYRSSNLTTVFFIVDLGTSASYDTVALIGSNLAASDTVRVRTGTSNTGIGSYDSGALAAWSGTKPATFTAKSIVSLPAAHSERYMRIDITSSAGAGYVEIQRLVVGLSVTTQGIDTNCEQSFVDPSPSFTGPGYESYDLYPVLPTWKVTTSWISDTQWRATFMPFFATVGQSRGFLFVPQIEVPTVWQTEAMFGRITTSAGGAAKGTHNSYDNWVVSIMLQAISA